MKAIRIAVPFFLSLVLLGCGGLQTPAELNGIAGQKGTAVNSADTFRFVVMADRNGGQETGKWAVAVEEINRLRPDFVMCVGDLTRGYKENPAATAGEWDEFQAENRGLRAPFFYCPGNHDVLGVETRKAYALRHNVDGRPYYSFDYRSCHFVVLDTTCLAEPKAKAAEADLAEAQWAWLEKDLAAARSARHTFILMHHPLWDRASLWAKLRPMIDPTRTTLMAGHTHELEYQVIDGVPCHTLAVTAVKTSGDRARGEFQMYAYVTVDAGQPTIAYIPVGEVLPLNTVDLAAIAVARGAIDQAMLSTISRHGGQTTLRLVNPTKNTMTCELQWTGPSPSLARIPAKAETLTLAPSGTAARTYEFLSLAGAELPALGLTYSYTLKNKPRTASGQIALTAVREIEAVRADNPTMDESGPLWTSNRPSAAGFPASRPVAEGASSRPAVALPDHSVQIGYDDRNLYIAVRAADDKIVAEGKEPWQRDGVEIFWDPRPADQQDGPFAGDCRQLLIPVPAEGSPAVVTTNPKDRDLAEAVQAQCVRAKAGYRILAAIPLTAIAKDFKPAPGASLRMDLYVDNKDDPKGAIAVTSLSGRAESSRKTAHYVIVRFR